MKELRLLNRQTTVVYFSALSFVSPLFLKLLSVSCLSNRRGIVSVLEVGLFVRELLSSFPSVARGCRQDADLCEDANRQDHHPRGGELRYD